MAERNNLWQFWSTRLVKSLPLFVSMSNRIVCQCVLCSSYSIYSTVRKLKVSFSFITELLLEMRSLLHQWDFPQSRERLLSEMSSPLLGKRQPQCLLTYYSYRRQAELPSRHISWGGRFARCYRCCVCYHRFLPSWHYAHCASIQQSSKLPDAVWNLPWLLYSGFDFVGENRNSLSNRTFYV